MPTNSQDPNGAPNFTRDPKKKPRRSIKHRILIGINIVLAVVLVAGIGVWGYATWRYGQISKISLDDVLNKNNGPKDPMTVLVVGSDTREGESKEASKSFGSSKLVQGQRSDTIMLLRVDPKAQRAAILSLPRDTYVTISGTNRKDRINAAFQDGPKQLIDTIQKSFNIPINHYVQVDFASFQSIVNTLGGVEIPFAAPVRDWGFDELTGVSRNLSGLDIPQPGCVRLDGKQALSYVRSRHFQVKEQSKWVSDPTGDLGRIQRQQDFMRRVMRVGGEKAKNPTTANALVGNVVQGLSMDKNGLSLTDIQALALRFRSLDPSKVQMMTIPTRAADVNGMSVLMPNDAEVRAVVQTFLNGQTSANNSGEATPRIAVGSISVRLLNGSGQDGQASDVAQQMRSAGFVVSTVGDARQNIEVTTIRYGHGQKEKADTLAKYLHGGATLVEDRNVLGVSAVVTLGKSFTGFAPDGNATTTTTSSTTSTMPAKSPPTTQSLFVPAADNMC